MRFAHWQLLVGAAAAAGLCVVTAITTLSRPKISFEECVSINEALLRTPERSRELCIAKLTP